MHELFKDCQDLLKVVDVMKALSTSRASVYRLIKAGKLKVIRIGYDYRIPKKSLIEYVQSADYFRKDD